MAESERKPMVEIEEAALTGEGDVLTVRNRRVRHCCEYCGEYAIYCYTFLLRNFRRNPQSKAYGRDDCSWVSDLDIFTCANCKPEVPDEYDPSWGRHTLGDNNHHIFLYWKEIGRVKEVQGG